MTIHAIVLKNLTDTIVMKYFNQIYTQYSIRHIAMMLSPVLCLVCLFFACGHPPGQDVKIVINTPKVPFAADQVVPVSVSLKLENYGNIFLTKNLSQGENEIFLPKGPFQISTGFFAQIPKNNTSPFVYAKVQQEVTITNNTNSLEVFYPQLKPIQYKKFGFIFKTQHKNQTIGASGINVTVQDPMSEAHIKNPLTGESLGFTTDANGFASVDLPAFDLMQDIRLVIQEPNNTDKILTIPADSADEAQFFEVILNKKITLNAIPITTGHYMDSTKTIYEIINTNKNPRFRDSITKDDFQTLVNNTLQNSKDHVNILDLFLTLQQQIKSSNPYILNGRALQIQCKPHKGIIYNECSQDISVEQFKNEDAIDYRLTDQDGFSMFSDKNSTRDNPGIITVNLRSL